MLNIHDLERRWKIYKLKSWLPYIIITLSLLIVAPLGYYFYINVSKTAVQKKVMRPKSAVKTIKIKETSIQTLKPSMNFMKNIQHKTTQPQYSQKNKSIAIKKRVKLSITIEKKETQNDIFEIVKRFKKNNNPTLSLFVAKKYYELGNYKQAYNYALITNQINADIEASWIVFAKALVQLHKKNKAIQILHEYIKVSHSSNAKRLLNEIKSGKFR